MALFGRKHRAPIEPDPAQGAADEWMSDPRALALEALADKLLTVPDLSTAAIDRLVELAEHGYRVEVCQRHDGAPQLDISHPDAHPQYETRWSVSAWLA